MCRNIRTLHNFDPPATEEEMRASALQYVRKVSGSTKPSKANEEAFDRAVDEIADVTARLLESLVTNAPPKTRAVEAAKLRERAAKRYAAAGAAASRRDQGRRARDAGRRALLRPDSRGPGRGRRQGRAAAW